MESFIKFGSEGESVRASAQQIVFVMDLWTAVSSVTYQILYTLHETLISHTLSTYYSICIWQIR